MNKAVKLISLSGLFFIFIFCLSSCSNTNKKVNHDSFNHFPVATPQATAAKGGSFKLALEADTPFKGIFANELASAEIDSQAMSPGNEHLFDTDNDYSINDRGAAILRINQAAKTAKITVKKGVKWSDGTNLTAQDLAYSYYVIANRHTKSPHYDPNLTDIVGLKNYHDGKAASISGIQMPDGPGGRTLILHFKQMHPGMLRSGNGYIWEAALPYHYLKKIPFADLATSKRIMTKPLFFGPYKMVGLVKGERTIWKPNKYYWRGRPKLKKIFCQLLNPSSAAISLKNKQFDMMEVVNSQWTQDRQIKGYRFIGQIPLQYSYLAFKVGKWNSKTGENQMDPHAKMNNQKLRQAMIYALNIEQTQKKYTDGLSFAIPSLILKQFGPYYDANIKGYHQNIAKANRLLDQAGFKRRGKYRVRPDGRSLTIRFAAKTGTSGQQQIIASYLRAWHRIGLNVVLTDGQLLDRNLFYEKLANDDPDIDVFEGAWFLSTVPAPDELYARTARFNYSRFTSNQNDRLLKQMDSDRAFLDSYRITKFHEWQRLMLRLAYVVPEANSYQIQAVKNTVVNVSTKPAQQNNGAPLWYQVGFKK